MFLSVLTYGINGVPSGNTSPLVFPYSENKGGGITVRNSIDPLRDEARPYLGQDRVLVPRPEFLDSMTGGKVLRDSTEGHLRWILIQRIALTISAPRSSV